VRSGTERNGKRAAPLPFFAWLIQDGCMAMSAAGKATLIVAALLSRR
jgi:hypothetical protein